MRFSKKTEYALRALFAIAKGPRGKVHQIHELSQRENIPVKFLEQILLSLRNVGILTSKRGVGGGYMLRRDPSEIAIGEIVRHLEGNFAPLPCSNHSSLEKCSCPDVTSCPVRHLAQKLNEQFTAVLDGQTVDDILRATQRPAGLAFDI